MINVSKIKLIQNKFRHTAFRSYSAFTSIISISKIKSVLIYTILPKFSLLGSILILPFISPYLTLSDYGTYGIILGYLMVFQMFTVLGQNVVLQNSFFEYKHHYFRVWQRSLGIMVLSGFLTSGIFALLIYFTLIKTIGHPWFWVILSSSLFLIFSPVEQVVTIYYTLKQKPIPLSVGALVAGILTTLTALITIKYFKIGYLGWIIALPMTNLVNFLFFFRRLVILEKIYPRLWIKKSFFIRAIRIGLPLTPHQISLYVISVSDRLLLSYFKIPLTQIGYYIQGYSMGSGGSILTTGIFSTFAKNIQESFRGKTDADRFFIRKALIFIPISIAACLFLAALWSKEIFSFLFKSKELAQSYPIAIIVFSGLMFNPIYSFFTYPLSINNQTFAISKITMMAAIFNILANIALIPYYGIWATACTTFISFLIMGMAGLLNRENRLFFMQYLNIDKLCLSLLILYLFLFGLAYFSKEFHPAIKLGYTFFLGIALLLFSKIMLTRYLHKLPSDEPLPNL